MFMKRLNQPAPPVYRECHISFKPLFLKAHHVHVYLFLFTFRACRGIASVKLAMMFIAHVGHGHCRNMLPQLVPDIFHTILKHQC